MLARVEGMPLDALRAGLDWQWSSFGDWLSRLDGRIGGQRRIPRRPHGDAAGGDGRRRDRRRRVADTDRGNGARSVDDACRRCLGFSTSQAPTHNDADGRAGAVAGRVARRAARAGRGGTRARRALTLEAILAGCLTGFTDDEHRPAADMSAAADRPLNWNVLGVSAINPDGHETQLAASERRGRTGRPGRRAHPAALDADPAVVPLRLRARRASRVARGAATCRCPSGCGRSPTPRCGAGSARAPSRRRPACCGPRRLGTTGDRRDVRARERRRRGPPGRRGRRRRAVATTRSTCCSTSWSPTSCAPGCRPRPFGDDEADWAAPCRGVARPATRWSAGPTPAPTST